MSTLGDEPFLTTVYLFKKGITQGVKLKSQLITMGHINRQVIENIKSRVYLTTVSFLIKSI